MLEFIVPALQNLFTIQNLLWINLGVFIGSVFAAIPGLPVILCIILFLPFTYQMTAIPGMMFLLGIYCAGGYGGSVSAILINTPGTPHAAATMLDGYPLNQQGRTKEEKKRMLRPMLISSIIGIIPGTGASMASLFSYDRARSMSKHPEEFGKGSVEGIAAAESANNAVTGATLIPLLTLGIPGDGCVAIMLSALMINGLNPVLSLFTDQGDIMYAIMLGLILVNVFMFVQGKFLTNLFAKVVSIPQEIASSPLAESVV